MSDSIRKRRSPSGKSAGKLNKKQRVLLDVMLFVCAAGLIFAAAMLIKNSVDESGDRTRVESDYNLFLNPTSTPDEDLYKDVVFPDGILNEMKPFYARNSETVGFLMIDGIDGFGYPVIQGNDNDEYFRTDLDGNYSREGTAFVDYRVDLENPMKNLIIHGHNNGNGLMFGPLTGYDCLHKNVGLTQYKKAPIITYYSLYEKHQYKIVAVVVANTDTKDGPTFDYVVSDFSNQEKFDTYKYEIDRRSVIDTGVDWQYGDNIIELHTCVYYWSGEGRLLVVARELRDGETADVDTSAAGIRYDAVMPDAYVDKYGKGIKASVANAEAAA